MTEDSRRRIEKFMKNVRNRGDLMRIRADKVRPSSWVRKMAERDYMEPKKTKTVNVVAKHFSKNL